MQKLSPVRGGSFAFLYSGALVNKTLEEGDFGAVSTLFTGASLGAWRLETADESRADAALNAARAALATYDKATGPHQHMAYVADIQKIEEGKEIEALALVEAKNALATRQRRSCPLPTWGEKAEKPDIYGDRIRPADVTDRLPDVGKVYVSSSHKDRRAFGRTQKQRFYDDFRAIVRGGMPGEDHASDTYSNDFHTLVKGGPKDLPLSALNKTAIFFADGNGLGKMRDKALVDGGLEGLSEFSARVKVLQADLIDALRNWLVAGAKQMPEAFTADQQASVPTRFETLMFGGDEMLFVMPCWLALPFASFFFDTVGPWRVNSAPLTFAAGLVVADVKAPIRLTKSLAEALAEAGKAVGGNTLQIEVFESLTVPDSRDLMGYRKRLLSPDRPLSTDLSKAVFNEALTISGFNVSDVFQRVKNVRDTAPATLLYTMINGAFAADALHMAGAGQEAAALFLRWKEHAGAEATLQLQDLDVLGTGTIDTLALSLHTILQLKDYTELVDFDVLSPIDDAA